MKLEVDPHFTPGDNTNNYFLEVRVQRRFLSKEKVDFYARFRSKANQTVLVLFLDHEENYNADPNFKADASG